MGDDSVTLGDATHPSDDLTPKIPDLQPWHVVIADNGRAALVLSSDGFVYVLDAKAKTYKKLVDAHSMTLSNVEEGKGRAIAADGHAVAWWDETGAHALDLESGAVVNERVDGKPPDASEVAGDVVAALFGDELRVASLSSGAELLDLHAVSDFVLGDDGGRTLAFIDATQRLQTLAVFDTVHPGEIARALIEDPPGTPMPGKFTGACGGGGFRLTALVGTVAHLDRGCTLIDHLNIDVASHLAPRGEPLMTSLTPANDIEEAELLAKAARRAGIVDDDARPSPALWLGARTRVIFRTMKGGVARLGVFDVLTGACVTTLEKSDDQSAEVAIAVTPAGTTVAGVDAKNIARLWDVRSGKVLYEKPLDDESAR